MKINSLKIAKFYSVGPLQKLEGFSSFNLFIGPNGSGKTNLLRVLSSLPYNFLMESKIGPTDFHKYFGFIFSNEMKNDVVNSYAQWSDIEGRLEVEFCFEDQDPQSIICEDSSGASMQYVCGDYLLYAQKTSLINSTETHENFKKKLSEFCAKTDKTGLLNFGTYYIFGRHYRFFKEGDFCQFSRKIESDFQKLPSGVLQMSKLLFQLIKSTEEEKTVFLIDEPELHIEPRHLRRFFEFLVWFCQRGNTNATQAVARIIRKVCKKLEDCVSENSAFFSDDDVNAICQNTIPKQVFISTHSSVLINEFLNLDEFASIYQFSLNSKRFQRQKVGPHGATEFEPVERLFSEIKKVDRDCAPILDSLGCKGSDLLQCNGVIWVEGPSDAIYIRKWLEMYASENNQPVLRQGSDYEFQMYGGAILDSLCLVKERSDENQKELELKKIVEMFSFSRNAYVVMDSDAVTNPDNGDLYDQSTFWKAKQFIKEQSETSQHGNVGLWYAENNTEFRTIESYLDEVSLMAVSKSLTKKLAAQQRVNDWTEKRLEEFPYELGQEIAKIYAAVSSW